MLLGNQTGGMGCFYSRKISMSPFLPDQISVPELEVLIKVRYSSTQVNITFAVKRSCSIIADYTVLRPMKEVILLLVPA